jgi:hypothetical protein
MPTVSNRLASSLVALALGLAACGSDSATPAPDAGPPWKLLQFRERHVGPRINGLRLTPDQKSLAFCAFDATVGFIDASTLQLTDSVDLRVEHPELAKTAYCRMSIIGDSAYAVFQPENVANGDPSAIVKLSLATHAVTAVWPLDIHWADTLITPYQGIVPTEAPERAFLAISRFHPQTWDPRVIYVDLDSGGQAIETLEPGPEILFLDIYGAVDGDHIIGALSSREPEKGFHFLASRSSGKMQKMTIGGGFVYALATDSSSNEFALGYGASSGIDIFDKSTGMLIRHLEYADGGFIPVLRFLPGRRLAHVTEGSDNAYMSILDATSGAPLAKAAFKAKVMFDAEVSADGTHLYGAGDGNVVDVVIPSDL